MSGLILGIAGEMGSGKGTIAKYLTLEHAGNTHRFSTILRDVLDRIHVEQSRDNLQSLSTILRKKFGEDILAKAIYHDTQKDGKNLVIIDGVRRMSDIAYLRELSYFKLIYVKAEIEKRYERIAKRGENSDDGKKTFEEFKKDQEKESESQINNLMDYADYIIDNNGTFEDLYKQIDDIIEENLK